MYMLVVYTSAYDTLLGFLEQLGNRTTKRSYFEYHSYKNYVSLRKRMIMKT